MTTAPKPKAPIAFGGFLLLGVLFYLTYSVAEEKTRQIYQSKESFCLEYAYRRIDNSFPNITTPDEQNVRRRRTERTIGRQISPEEWQDWKAWDSAQFFSEHNSIEIPKIDCTQIVRLANYVTACAKGRKCERRDHLRPSKEDFRLQSY